MYSLSNLLNKTRTTAQARMVASGVGIWICYSGLDTQPMIQTMRDHGGICIVEDNNQALWFFFDKEAYRALARLQVWLRLKSQSILFAVMPATFLVAYDGSQSLSVAPDLRDQTLQSLGETEILVHPKLEEAVSSIPGLELRDASPVSGLAGIKWKNLSIDPSFSYESELGWYFVLKPLGKKLEYASAWRLFFSRVEAVLQKVGVKFIFNDGSLSVALDNVRIFRAWAKEIILLLQELKATNDPASWPMVMAVVARKGYNFNEDLVRKVSLDWNRLTPGFPHVTYRDGYILGDAFVVNELGYNLDQCKVDDWCYISLAAGQESQVADETTQLKLPRTLLAGAGAECFHCGLKSHLTTECPTHAFDDLSHGVWDELAKIPIGQFTPTSTKLDKKLSSGSLEKALEDVGNEGVLARAIFESGAPFQLRTLGLVWRSRSKDWVDAFKQLGPPEGEFIWEALERLKSGEYEDAEKLIKRAAQRYPRSYQPKSLAAFLSLLQDDMAQAAYNFSEAARFSYTPAQKVCFLMLQARVFDVSGDYERAITLYREAETQSRGWVEAKYRQGVCLVKMGFTDHASSIFNECLDRDPHYFNRVLVEPELDRGRYQVQLAMGEVWSKAKEQRTQSLQELEELCNKLDAWFSPEHEFGIATRERLNELKTYGEIENYVYFRRLEEGCHALDAEIESRVENEVSTLGKKVERHFEQLRNIMREASWFPYPGLLREFNKDFNFCADKINWLSTQYLKSAENFTRAHTYLQEIESRMDQLKSRLVSLRVLRDGTFFMLLLGKNFIWMQLLGLAVALMMLPLITHFSDSLSGIMPDLIRNQQWQLQKGLILVMSVIALGLAILRTGVSFETKKQAFFDKEYQKAQAIRGDKQALRRGLGRRAPRRGKVGPPRAA